MQDGNADEITDLVQKKSSDDSGSKDRFMKEVEERVSMFLEILPDDLESLERNEELIKNPLFRFIDREISASKKLLKIVKSSLG